MFSNEWRKWLKSLRAAVRGTPPGRRPRRQRPQLEGLEDRTVPAVSFVASAAVVPAVNRPDVQLGNFNGFEEPNLTINGRFDPGNIAISSQNSMIVSTDAFVNTQTSTFQTPPGSMGNFGDTWADFDSQNRLFWTNLDGRQFNPTLNRTEIGLAVEQVNPTTAAAVGVTSVVQNPPLNSTDDRQALAVDDNPTSPFHDNIYVIWTRFVTMPGPNGMVGDNDDVNVTRVLVSRSIDQGVNWSVPVVVGQTEGVDGMLGNGDDEGFVQQVFISVAQNGDVLASYHSQTGFVNNGGGIGVPNGTSGQTFVARSTDGGLTFNKTGQAPFGPGQADITFNRRQRGFTAGIIPGTQFLTQGSVSPYVYESPTNANVLYAFSADDPDNMHGNGDDADIVFARSTDGGATWNRITLFAGTNNSFQLFPTAAIDRFGTLVVGFYTNERQLTNSGPDGVAGNADDDFLLDFYAMYSVDGGLTWTTPFRVNDAAFDPDKPPTVGFGDPDGADADTGYDFEEPDNIAGNADDETTTRIGEYFGLDVFAGTAYVAFNGNSPTAGTSQQLIYDAFPIAGALTITGDDTGAPTDDNILVRRLGANNDYVEVFVNGQRQYFGLLSALSGGIQVNGLNGDDTLTVDYVNGDPTSTGGLSFDGNADLNTLRVLNHVNTWDVTGLNSGDVNGAGVVDFVHTQNLTGDTPRDVFHFVTGGKVSGVVDGGGSGDYLDYSARTGSVIVNLQTHKASATGGIANIQHVLGSAKGGDRLTGDSQGNILIGHRKGNVLRAGTGRGVLIGGIGINTLIGNSADDLEIAGKTVYDNSPNDLDAVFAAWNDPNKGYNQRIADLRSGNGLAAGRTLVVGQTVFLEPSNGVVGPRFGRGGGNSYSTLAGDGGLDWFFTAVVTAITDRQPDEQIN